MIERVSRGNDQSTDRLPSNQISERIKIAEALEPLRHSHSLPAFKIKDISLMTQLADSLKLIKQPVFLNQSPELPKIQTKRKKPFVIKKSVSSVRQQNSSLLEGVESSTPGVNLNSLMLDFKRRRLPLMDSSRISYKKPSIEKPENEESIIEQLQRFSEFMPPPSIPKIPKKNQFKVNLTKIERFRNKFSRRKLQSQQNKSNNQDTESASDNSEAISTH